MDEAPLPDELQQHTPLNDAQRVEIAARLAHHRAHPDEPDITLEEIRRKLVAG